MEAETWDSRTRRLLGEEQSDRLAKMHILVLGIGGVGGYVAEFLGRCGVGALTLVDGDRVSLSNLNRQIPALSSTIGRFKAEVMAERLREINPAGRFEAVNRFVQAAEAASLLDSSDFDGAIDAIDDVAAKVAFIQACFSKSLPVVSSMGAGNKLDPGAVTTADISKSHGCPLARSVRRQLRESGVTRGVPVVFSPEVIKNPSGSFGTVSFMTSVFASHCTAELLKRLLVD